MWRSATARPFTSARSEPRTKTRCSTFLEGLDQGSRMFRFFSAGTDLRGSRPTDGWMSTTRRRYGLVAVRGARRRGGRVRGTTSAVAQRGGDRIHNRPRTCRDCGLGTLLLAHLAEVAQDNGISVFTAEVMPENHRMIEVFRESGFPVEIVVRGRASIHVELPTSFSDEAVRRIRGSRPAGGAGRDSPVPRAAGSRRDRCLAQARNGGRPALPQRTGSPASRVSSTR